MINQKKENKKMEQAKQKKIHKAETLFTHTFTDGYKIFGTPEDGNFDKFGKVDEKGHHAKIEDLEGWKDHIDGKDVYLAFPFRIKGSGVYQYNVETSIYENISNDDEWITAHSDYYNAEGHIIYDPEQE